MELNISQDKFLSTFGDDHYSPIAALSSSLLECKLPVCSGDSLWAILPALFEGAELDAIKTAVLEKLSLSDAPAEMEFGNDETAGYPEAFGVLVDLNEVQLMAFRRSYKICVKEMDMATSISNLEAAAEEDNQGHTHYYRNQLTGISGRLDKAVGSILHAAADSTHRFSADEHKPNLKTAANLVRQFVGVTPAI